MVFLYPPTICSPKSSRKAVFSAPTATGVQRLRNTSSSLWEVICHKKVQQSFLNQSLDPPIKSSWIRPCCAHLMPENQYLVTSSLLRRGSRWVSPSKRPLRRRESYLHKMVLWSSLECSIIDCVHSYFISLCQTPFWNMSLAASTKPGTAPDLSKTVCAQGPGAHFCAVVQGLVLVLGHRPATRPNSSLGT